jgi:hypothetical protein
MRRFAKQNQRVKNINKFEILRFPKDTKEIDVDDAFMGYSYTRESLPKPDLADLQRWMAAEAFIRPGA